MAKETGIPGNTIYTTLLLFAVLVSAACGTYVAPLPELGADAGGDADARDAAPPDAPAPSSMPDAGEMPDGSTPPFGENGPVVLSAANSNTMTSEAPVCRLPIQGLGHYNQSYYRTYQLTGYNVLGPFEVTGVSIGIDQSVPADTLQPVVASVYRQVGELGTTGSLQLLTDAQVNVGALAREMLDIEVPPVTVAAGTTLVVRFSIYYGYHVTPPPAPNLPPLYRYNFLRIGANHEGENSPAYLLAPDCNLRSLGSYSIGAQAGEHIVLNLNGNAL